MVAPEREMPGISARHCQQPMTNASIGRQRGHRVAAPPRAAQALAEQQQEPVHHQERGGNQRRAEQAAQEVLEQRSRR